MPEHIKLVGIPCKVLYKCSALPLPPEECHPGRSTPSLLVMPLRVLVIKMAGTVCSQLYVNKPVSVSNINFATDNKNCTKHCALWNVHKN